jgi:phosphopantothenoylcysteine decarboxylase/phosphopantothenate--cysteine ligase
VLVGKRILLGVTGGIAAYRACELARLLVKEGAQVQVVLTERAAHFVTPLTFTALTGNTAVVDEFPRSGDPDGQSDDVYAHLNLPRGIDCFVVAPATADSLARFALGLADNLLSTAYLANTAPVVIAPAMNVRMWEHQAVQANVATLKGRGHTIVEPGAGMLACGDVGAGRLAEPEQILAHINGLMGTDTGGDLAGRRIVVTAGGTREYLDPVRFITNASSGNLGLAVARELAGRGALVDLVETGLEVPDDMASLLDSRIRALTAFDLQSTLSRLFPAADGLVMLAAVADYSPTQYSSRKRKKDGGLWNVELSQTPDVLASITATRRPGQLVAGVSLEDDDWIKRGQVKAQTKGADVMLAVELSAEPPFGKGRLQCALVSAAEVLAPPRLREKSQAAGLIAQWLAEGFDKLAPADEQPASPDTQAVQPLSQE